MNDDRVKMVAAATAEANRLKKRVSYWKGRAKAELNKRWRAMYAKATRPDSVDAFLATQTALDNFATMAENYKAVAAQESAALAKIEAALKLMREEARG